MSFLVAVELGAIAVRMPAAQALNRGRPLCSDVALPTDGAEYLSYFRGSLDHHVVYNNFHHAADELRKADVLILGNSRVQHAFANEPMLDQFFGARSLRYYVLAFAYGEGSEFPELLIRKYNLHPRWVIVSADPFFGPVLSKMGTKAVADSGFDAFKYCFESDAAFEVERQLHRVVPFLGPAQWVEGRPDVIAFRSARTGVTHTITTLPPEPLPAFAGKDAWGSVWEPCRVSNAITFKNLIESRGGRLILTRVPPDSAMSAERFSGTLNIPFIDVGLAGLSTFDGSHLDAPSADRFLEAFLRALTPVVDCPTSR